MSVMSYAYATPSFIGELQIPSIPSLERIGDISHAKDLQLSTSGGITPLGQIERPYFFSGFVAHPAVVAQGLLMLARVARTRFYTPPNVLAKLIRAADPVVTSTPEGLRMESFSVCCGVYARLDIDTDALDTIYLSTGVTNVDVNPPLRQAMARLQADDPLHFRVGSDQLQVTTGGQKVIEEKVELPKRWLKSFAETQMLSAGMRRQFSISGPALLRFMRTIPKNSSTNTVMWAAPLQHSVRLGTRPSPGSVCVAGPERLKTLEPLIRFATALHAYGPDVSRDSMPCPSVWVLEVPGGRMSIALSPEKARGFSGEGSVLHALSGSDVADDAELISGLLSFEPRIDIPELSRMSDLESDRVQSALSLLASSGQVGYDLHEGAYFHRPLPVDPDALNAMHPRLVNAKKLVDKQAVTEIDPDTFEVLSAGVTYTVQLGISADEDRCTCPWYAKHRGTRGPCKHVLASRIFAERITL